MIPELRFPDFRDAESWKEKTLEEVAKYENGKAHEQDIDVNGKFIVVNAKFISTDGEVKKYTNTAFCPAKKGDILMVLSDVPNGRAIAKCFFVDKDDFYTVNQRICKLTPTKAEGKLLYYLLNRSPYFLSFDDGAKQTNLKNEDVLNCPLLLPKEPNEQQKIATCLSSLDEVIAGNSQKLDSLKTHKKFLMQNLFPQEGETIPNYRFPEFVNDGEWNSTRLNKIASISSGGTPSRAKTEYWNGNIPWASTTLIDFNEIKKVNEFITPLGLENSSTKIFPKGTILMAMYGQGKTRGKVAILGLDASINQACAAITLKKGLNTNFVFQNLAGRYDEIRSISNPGGQENLSGELIKNITICYPNVISGEQQKIAECLSSLDDLITSQSEKIEQLKLHKKGLMQGLFPKVEMEQEYNQRSASTVNSAFQLIEI